ncbi:MAG TPA: aldo/keto reductase [Hyphomicrobiaceae bacterium]|nr:aldo/keto reductase [Hyphomicrobiaceae bacterium]
MNHTVRRRIARTALKVPVLGFGGATLGDAQGAISEQQALAAIEAGYLAGIDYFDTSPWYGNTKSELRFGAVLRDKPRASFVLSTKIGRVYAKCTDPAHPSQVRWQGGLPFSPTFDYTREGVLGSYEQSLLRLGLAKVDALLIHDIDEGHQGSAAGVEQRLGELADGGGYEALVRLKAAGEIAAIGAGVNRIGMIAKFLERFDLDFFLLAMPYTLLSQDALSEELPLCLTRGVSIVIGAPFASGILASGAVLNASYGYQPAPGAMLEKTRQIAGVCQRHRVPLGAAALQFPLAHPAVVSVIPGPSSADQVRANVKWIAHAIPAAFWDELKEKGLLRKDAPVPTAG